MNRRSFFKQLAIGAATFMILPPATTYERIWKARREWMVSIFYRREVITGKDFTAFVIEETPSYWNLVLPDEQWHRMTPEMMQRPEMMAILRRTPLRVPAKDCIYATPS